MPRIAPLLEGAPAIVADLIEDATLAPGQVYLRLGETEQEIDLAEVLAGIDAAIRAFFDETQQGKASA
jgi:flagellar assembly protein FliH